MATSSYASNFVDGKNLAKEIVWKELVENNLDIRRDMKKFLGKDKEFLICHSCTNPVGQQCRGCMIGHFYCSSQCQRTDWKEHKANCGKRYKCEEVPKKRMGNIATRNISKGEIICVERPILMIDTFKDICIDDIKKVYNKKFRKLSSEQQVAIMNLTYEYKDKKNSPNDKQFAKFIGIIMSNVMDLQKFDMRKSGLFLDCCRFNHSCIPNAETYFSDPYLRVYAVRDIVKGEEICISYYGDNFLAIRDTPNDTPPIIQDLKVAKGLSVTPFVCYCKLCQMEDETVLEEMNDYRIKFWKLQKKFYQAQPGSLQYIRICHEVLDYINSNGRLHLFWTDFFSRKGLGSALMVKEKDEAKYFLKQYHESAVIRKGKDSPSAVVARQCQILIESDDLEKTEIFDVLIDCICMATV